MQQIESAAPVARAGDLWLLGAHRLVCGDATDPAIVALALSGSDGRTVRPHLMVTDPPYGVRYDPAWRGKVVDRASGRRKSVGAVGAIANDDRADWREAWALFPGDIAYVWHGALNGHVVREGLEACRARLPRRRDRRRLRRRRGAALGAPYRSPRGARLAERLMGEIDVTIKFQDLTRLETMIRDAGLKAPYAIARAIDAVGNRTMTQVKRAVAAQAGVPVGRAGAVLSRRQAMGAGGGSFTIVARDATMSLKEFGPRRTAKGVSAAPWHKRRVFPHTFMGPGGHVYVREGKARLPIKKLYGPNIPKEMVKDHTEQTFYAYTAQALPAELEKWLFKALG